MMKNLKRKKYSIIGVISKYSFIFIVAFTLVMPFAFTVAIEGTGPAEGTGKSEGTGSAIKIDGISNPIQGINTLPEFIEAIINIVLIIGIPLLVLAVIYAGFLYVKAQGNPGELEVAHRTLLYTVIGGALLLGAFVIANAIGRTVDEIKSTT